MSVGRKEKWSRTGWVTPTLRGLGTGELKASEREQRWGRPDSLLAGAARPVRKVPGFHMHPSVCLFLPFHHFLHFPGSSVSKESACNVGDLGLTPGLGRSPGGGHGNPLQCSCQENAHGQRRLVGYSPWGRKESDTTE